MSDFSPGQCVEWLRTPPGGYGYTHWVPAKVIKINKSRVLIAARLKNGRTKQVNVMPSKLRPA